MGISFESQRQFLIAFLKAAVEYDTLECGEQAWIDKIIYDLERIDYLIDLWESIGLTNMSRLLTDNKYFEEHKKYFDSVRGYIKEEAL